MQILTTPRMLVPASASIIGKMGDFSKMYCVYEHWGYRDIDASDAEEQLMYIGVSPMSNVYDFHDARINSKWQEIFIHNSPLRIVIIATSINVNECHNFKYQQVRDRKPFCNIYGTQPQANMPVVCNETNEEFETAAAACERYDIAPSSMSNHLRGKSGYKRLKGFTFRRGFASDKV